MIYFTSDLHIGDHRVGDDNYPNVLYRPFMSIRAQNNHILEKLKIVSPSDVLFVVGDVLCDLEYEKCLNFLPKCKKRFLIVGNHDEKKLNILSKYFDVILEQKIIKLNDFNVLVNHYPQKCFETMGENQNIDFSITGHVHSLWKVSNKMINVSTDAWHFFPVSETEILFTYNAMKNFFDQNVFPYGT